MTVTNSNMVSGSSDSLEDLELTTSDATCTSAKLQRSDDFECKPPRILVAEDDREMRVLLVSQLRRAGYQVVECRDGEQLVQTLASTFLPNAHRNDFDLVISDVRMPGFSGLEVLDGLHDRERFPPIILITAFGDTEAHSRARRLGAVAMLDKPFRLRYLLTLVHQIIREQPRRRPQLGEISVSQPSQTETSPCRQRKEH